MASDLILTPAQAQAVYSAMCALNNVGGRIDNIFVGGSALVRETHSGRVRVLSALGAGEKETYRDQSAFAAAYGL